MNGIPGTIVQDRVVVCKIISEVEIRERNYRSFVVSMIIKMLS